MTIAGQKTVALTMSDLPPLIMLPGLLCNRNLWAHSLDNLSHQANMQVADLSGHESVEDLAKAVLEMAPPTFALAGLSMGGYVAFEIWRQAPERVERLALMNTSSRPDTAEQTKQRKALLSLAEIGKFKGVTPRLLPLLIHESRLDDTLLTAQVTAMAEDIGREGFVRQQKAVLARPDSRPTLPTIDCPVLVIGGADDQLTPPDLQREIASEISGSRLEILGSCGHLAPMEHPEFVTSALAEWLAA